MCAPHKPEGYPTSERFFISYILVMALCAQRKFEAALVEFVDYTPLFPLLIRACRLVRWFRFLHSLCFEFSLHKVRHRLHNGYVNMRHLASGWFKEFG